MLTCAPSSLCWRCWTSRRSTETLTASSSSAPRWGLMCLWIQPQMYFSETDICKTRFSVISFFRHDDVVFENHIWLFQANRKQSLNYGCIVENERTDEVIKIIILCIIKSCNNKWDHNWPQNQAQVSFVNVCIIWKMNKSYFHWCMVCYDRTIFVNLESEGAKKSKYWENHL